jgi:hypothetical protein
MFCMKVIIQLTRDEEAKALPILLRHSPGMILPQQTYVVSGEALRALRNAGIRFTELSREATAASFAVRARQEPRPTSYCIGSPLAISSGGNGNGERTSGYDLGQRKSGRLWLAGPLKSSRTFSSSSADPCEIPSRNLTGPACGRSSDCRWRPEQHQ